MVEKILIYNATRSLRLTAATLLDRFMWIFTGKAVWLPLAFLILLVLIYKKNWRESLLILLAIVLVVTLCDQFASHVCKPVFTRFRPTHHPDFMDQVKNCFRIPGRTLRIYFQPCCERFRFRDSYGIDHADKLFGWTIFSGRLLLLIHGFISGFTSFRISCREPFRCVLRLSGLQALFFQPFEVASCAGE